MPKPPASPQDARTIAPHPLAIRLIERLRTEPHGRVLDFASGSGRNATALSRAGFVVVAIDDRMAASQTPFDGISGRFAAALSTHGLLHGTVLTIGTNLAQIAALLEKNGVLYATFGSVRDARFGQGDAFDRWTYAPRDGDERGVRHCYFDRDRLTGLLDLHFAIESLEERPVDAIAGSWAHQGQPLSGAVQWFATATAT